LEGCIAVFQAPWIGCFRRQAVIHRYHDRTDAAAQSQAKSQFAVQVAHNETSTVDVEDAGGCSFHVLRHVDANRYLWRPFWPRDLLVADFNPAFIQLGVEHGGHFA
jgi:hypothetical protein